MQVRWSMSIWTVVLAAVVLGACGSDGAPAVVFAGEMCDYSGPSNFDLNSLPSLEVTNNSDVDAEFVMLELDPAIVMAEVVAASDALASHADLPAGIVARNSSGRLEPGERRAFTVAFSQETNYLPACLTMVLDPESRQAILSAEFVSVP